MCQCVDLVNTSRRDLRAAPVRLIDETGSNGYYASRDAKTYTRALNERGMSSFMAVSPDDRRACGLIVCMAMRKIGTVCQKEPHVAPGRQLVSQIQGMVATAKLPRLPAAQL